MANMPSWLSLSFSLLLLFNGCLARPGSEQEFQLQNECQINRLNSIEPTSKIRSEAGTTEWWNPNSQQLKCAGVSVMRQNVEPNGLVLPYFTNAPQLIYIVQGRGIQGTVLPGCAETFQESQQGQGQQRQGRSRDQHQKIRRFRQGDVLALPAGVVHWFYNDGNERLVTVNLLHTANDDNQLDNNPRRFSLSGNPEEEQMRLRRFAQQQMQGRWSESEREEEEQDNPSRSHEQQSSSCHNLLCAFDSEFLAQAFNVDTSLIRKLQEVRGHKGSIIRVRDRLDVVSPPRMEEEEREERQQEQRYRERHPYGRDNGVEETFCAMRMKENIADPERADILNPQAGRLSTLNKFNLPILNALGLSAEMGVLYNRAGTVPQWCINAHKILYMLKGRCRIQVVNQNGDTVFDDNVEEGQLLTVPQNYAFMKRAGSEGAEWVSFFTNSEAANTPMAGRVSAMRALPEEVVAASYQISREDARKVKYNNQDTLFFTSSRSEMRDEA